MLNTTIDYSIHNIIRIKKHCRHNPFVERIQNRMVKCTTTFCINTYLYKMDKIIRRILSRPENEIITYDILDTEKSIKNKWIALKERQRQMKVGEIWQEVIGNYDGLIM